MLSFKKELVIILITVSLVFASGCIEFGEDEEPAAYGLTIETLEAIPSQVFSGDTFELVLDVRNLGGVEAREIEPELYTAGGASTTDDFTPSSVGSLNPPTADFEGEGASFSLDMSAPTLSVSDETVRPEVRVPYKYKTESRILIPVLHEEEYRAIEGTDETVPRIEKARVTDGPFTVDITGPNPGRVGDGDIEVPFTVSGSNIGGGTAYLESGHPSPGTDDLNRIDIDVDIDHDDFDMSEDACDESSIRLRKDGSFHISCTMSFDGDIDDVTFEEVPVSLTLDYGYRIRQRTSAYVRRD